MPSHSKKQHNFMEAVAHSPKFAKKVGVPQSVGKDFSAADKGMKFKRGGKTRRFTEGGTVPENRDFKDTSKTDDLEDTDTGGFVRDSSGNRVRGTYSYLTWGEGPSKRTKPAASPASPASPARQKVEVSDTDPYGVPPPPRQKVEVSDTDPYGVPPPPRPNAGKTPAMPKVPAAPPPPPPPEKPKPKVDVSDEDPYGTPPPPRENRSEVAPPLPIKVPPLPGGGRVPPKPSAQALPPPEESKPNRGPALPPPKDNKVKLPGPAKVETTFNDQGRKPLAGPPKVALPAPETPKLPAPTASQLQAELVRLLEVDPGRRMGWREALSLLPQGKIAKVALPKLFDKIFGSESGVPVLPSPARSTAVAKREVKAESDSVRPPRPMPGRPDSDDKEEQRRKLEKKRREIAEGKTTNFAKGGFVKKSIDGCAQRGKTRGQIR
jgi:hypothetical protein